MKTNLKISSEHINLEVRLLLLVIIAFVVLSGNKHKCHIHLQNTSEHLRNSGCEDMTV
jgi:hypothetical protein